MTVDNQDLVESGADQSIHRLHEHLDMSLGARREAAGKAHVVEGVAEPLRRQGDDAITDVLLHPFNHGIQLNGIGEQRQMMPVLLERSDWIDGDIALFVHIADVGPVHFTKLHRCLL